MAPRDYHLLIDHGRFALSRSALVFARPSIDVLFESVADEYRERAIGVILTGGSRDGVRGLAKIKSLGGVTMGQDPGTADNREMPEAAIATNSVDWIVPLAEIAQRLQNVSAAAGQYV